MQRWLLSIAMVVGFVATAAAQDSYDAKVKAYIQKYKALAVAEQKRGGIPASIILAQGIHETQAGCSELATMANNHFGIKCKKTWTGETFAHTDDAPNECFRKYSSSEASYIDHTDYLVKTPRYAELFKLSITDYPAWAMGLRKCGYATNPRYAQVLIKLIEDYRLQEYTYAAMNNAEIIPEHDAVLVQKNETPKAAEPAPAIVEAVKPEVVPPVVETVKVTEPSVAQAEVPVAATPSVESSLTESSIKPAEPMEGPVQERRVYGKEVRVNGLRAIYGRRGETPLGYAYNAGVRYSKLLDINEIDERPLPVDMYLYLERKNTRSTKATHVVKEGENLFMVAQEEGMQIKSLMDLNLMLPGDEPAAGEVLHLQDMAEVKPKLAAVKTRIPVKQAGTNKPVVAPYATSTTAAANKPVRVSRMKVSYDMPPAPSNVAAGVPPNAAKPATVELPKEQPAEVVTKAEPVVAPNEIKDPTQEETNNGFPKVAEPRYASNSEPATTIGTTPGAAVSAIPGPVPVTVPAADPVLTDAPEAASAQKVTEVVKEEIKPEPVREIILPTAEPTASLDATTVKEKPTKVTVDAPKPVAVPVIEEEPKDELDKLKKKFDKVVYANEQKIAAANQPLAPVTEAPKAAPVEPEPKVVPNARTQGPKYYTVKKGDTGFSIAKKNGITLSQLMEWNNMDFSNADIKEGQKLKVKQ